MVEVGGWALKVITGHCQQGAREEGVEGVEKGGGGGGKRGREKGALVNCTMFDWFTQIKWKGRACIVKAQHSDGPVSMHNTQR